MAIQVSLLLVLLGIGVNAACLKGQYLSGVCTAVSDADFSLRLLAQAELKRHPLFRMPSPPFLSSTPAVRSRQVQHHDNSYIMYSVPSGEVWLHHRCSNMHGGVPSWQVWLRGWSHLLGVHGAV